MVTLLWHFSTLPLLDPSATPKYFQSPQHITIFCLCLCKYCFNALLENSYTSLKAHFRHLLREALFLSSRPSFLHSPGLITPLSLYTDVPNTSCKTDRSHACTSLGDRAKMWILTHLRRDWSWRVFSSNNLAGGVGAASLWANSEPQGYRTEVSKAPSQAANPFLCNRTGTRLVCPCVECSVCADTVLHMPCH